MKYLKLSFLFFILSFCGLAYTPSSIRYNEHEFQNYLIPHSTQLVGDYYELIHIVLPGMSNAKTTFLEIFKIQKNFHRLYQCQKDCKEIASEMKNAHIQIENELNQIKTKFSPKSFEKLKLHFFLTSIFTSILYENFLMKKKTDLLLLEPYFNQLHLEFNFFLLSILPKHLNATFEEFWSFFVKRLYDNVMLKPEDKFYKININDLNFQFNEFNLKMGKRNAANLSEAKSKMTQMMNQWNVILKIILRL